MTMTKMVRGAPTFTLRELNPGAEGRNGSAAEDLIL